MTLDLYCFYSKGIRVNIELQVYSVTYCCPYKDVWTTAWQVSAYCQILIESVLYFEDNTVENPLVKFDSFV
jgi:hypothetical protein